LPMDASGSFPAAKQQVIILVNHHHMGCGLARLIEAVRYHQEGHEFDPRMGNFIDNPSGRIMTLGSTQPPT